jgi:MFS family permease
VSNFSLTAAIQNEVPHLEDIGFPLATAATALGAVGLGSLVGKFLFGWVCDKVYAKYACAIGCVIQLNAIFILNSVQAESSVAIIWLYAILAGLGLGSWLPTMSILVANNFGLASYGAIFGITNMSQCVGASVGPLFASHMYDITHTYHQTFIILELLYVISIPAILFAERTRQKQAQPY